MVRVVAMQKKPLYGLDCLYLLAKLLQSQLALFEIGKTNDATTQRVTYMPQG